MKPVVYLNSMGKRLKEIEGTILLNKNNLFEVELQNNSDNSYLVDILINDRTALSSCTLNKKDNIKVHKNDLRHLVNAPLAELIRCEHDNIGNTKVNTLAESYNEIKPCEIPYDCKYKHDMTKWKINKQKTKEKNNRRKYKIDANNNIW